LNRCYRNMLFFALIGIGILAAGTYAQAADEVSSGRRLWDNIMLWVNFGILVFLFIRYAKEPLMKFLRGQKEKVELELNNFNEQLEEKTALFEAEALKLKNIDARIDEIQTRLTQLGERERAEIIEQAQAEAQRIIEKAELAANSAVTSAKKTLNAELADIAIEIVKERLHKGLSPADQENLVDQFLTGLSANRRLVRAKI